mmetsp:Transcript_2703/g.5560  ORF Transcript_2703/g.5560 Transcript_2703/m.5560 type:complete len:196 (+) Transcript_2703:890-1477(+)
MQQPREQSIPIIPCCNKSVSIPSTLPSSLLPTTMLGITCPTALPITAKSDAIVVARSRSDTPNQFDDKRPGEFTNIGCPKAQRHCPMKTPQYLPSPSFIVTTDRYLMIEPKDVDTEPNTTAVRREPLRTNQLPRIVPGRYRYWYVNARLFTLVFSEEVEKKYWEDKSDIGAKVVQRAAFVRVVREKRRRISQRLG